MSPNKDYGKMNRLQLIKSEEQHHVRKQHREVVLNVLAFPIVNVAIFITAMIVMSKNVQGMMLGNGGSDALVFVGFAGMFYAVMRLLPRQERRHQLYEGVLSGGSRAGW